MSNGNTTRLVTAPAHTVKPGDILIGTAGNSVIRQIVTQVRRGGRVVLDFRGPAGSNYVALEPGDTVTLDTRKDEPLTPENYGATLYEGSPCYYAPPVTGGYIAARVIALDLEARTVDLQITSTRPPSGYTRGEIVRGLPYSRVACRGAVRVSRQVPGMKYELFRPRFSARWIDYLTPAAVAAAAPATPDTLNTEG
jgi:hypothetical protein